MSGTTPRVAIGRPVYMSAQDPTQAAKQQDLENIRMQAEQRDRDRAAAPRMRLVAVTAFNLVDDENPNGKVINPGDVIEISAYDHHAYAGRAIPPAVDDRDPDHIIR